VEAKAYPHLEITALKVKFPYRNTGEVMNTVVQAVRKDTDLDQIKERFTERGYCAIKILCKEDKVPKRHIALCLTFLVFL